MRVIALTAAVIAASLASAGGAQAAELTSAGPGISYIADQGERNDVVVSTNVVLLAPVFTFTDADANPIRIGPAGAPSPLCSVSNGVGMCRADGITSMYIDVRDRDDTAQISTAGGGGLSPPLILSTLVGGNGVDTLMGGFGPEIIKGNNGRDSLRGRQGLDVYKGGRGSDTLQTLDGLHDTFISCGEGGRDLLRADKIDPRPKSCELGGRKPGKQF
jgi:Ca2+-binding RTX toxin-like protein